MESASDRWLTKISLIFVLGNTGIAAYVYGPAGEFPDLPHFPQPTPGILFAFENS